MVDVLEDYACYRPILDLHEAPETSEHLVMAAAFEPDVFRSDVDQAVACSTWYFAP